MEHRLSRPEHSDNGYFNQRNHQNHREHDDNDHNQDEIARNGESRTINKQNGHDNHALKQNGHHQSPRENGSASAGATSAQSIEVGFSQEQELFLQYIKANPEILSSLGIIIPNQVLF